MVSLKKPKLGTPTTAWRHYSVHLMGSYLVREFFLVSNYRRSIELTFPYFDNTKKQIEVIEKHGLSSPSKDFLLTNAKELSNWAREMESEQYHELYVRSFVGLWSAFETGLENIIRDFIRNDKVSAQRISDKFQNGNKYPLQEWPWDDSVCLEIAQKIEGKAKNETFNGGVNFSGRLITAFSWLGINIEIDDLHQASLNEANRARNIILHRYGEVSVKDAEDFPLLEKWIGEVMPINKELYTRYYNGMTNAVIAIVFGIEQQSKKA
jgi:hypothetical protein